MSVQRCPYCACSFVQFEPFTYGNVAISYSREIVLEGQHIKMPKSQHIIAEALIRAQGRRLTQEFLAVVLGKDIFNSTTIKYIQRTRQEFRRVVPTFDQIISDRGFGGYRWAFMPAKSPFAPALKLDEESVADRYGLWSRHTVLGAFG